MHFERQNAFQNASNHIIFQKKKICVPTLPKMFRPVTRNTLIFLFGLDNLTCTLMLMNY